MDYESAKHRAEELRELLNYYSRKYYAEDDPVVEDHEYDMLQRELLAIEQQFPDLQAPGQAVVAGLEATESNLMLIYLCLVFSRQH